jgi:UDP-N-acetylmuramate--alanine ligase
MEHAAALVISAAVPGDHPEILEAVRLGIPVFKRAKALGQWVNQGRVLAVAGTHGKTTTTAMAAEILTVAGLDPTGLVGGRVPSWKGNLRRGGELYVVEADEYDRSFLELQPTVAIVTSVEADHLDTYGGLEGVAAAFHEFLEALPEDGRGIICGDDHGASRLLPALDRRGYTYGTGAGCQLRAVDVKATSAGMEFTVMEEGIDRGAYRLPVPGLHNLRNALGATAAARFFGVDWDAIRKGLASFQGVARRFDTVGEVGQILVVDDYAHHPSEITATLAAARAAHPDRRIVAVFQPHLFTRTRDFAEDFGRALTAADVVWVTDIFPAREDPIAGVTGELVAFAADRRGATVHYHVEIDTLPEAVVEELAAGDLLVTMGAGSVDGVARRVITLLEGRNLA